MGMLINGLNLIRGFWGSLHDALELGHGTTQETAQDTDLESVISASQVNTLVSYTADQFLKLEASSPGITADSIVSASELIWKTSSPELAGSRVTFDGLDMISSGDTIIDTRWYFKGRR